MLLRLESTEFSIEHAKVRLIPTDWGSVVSDSGPLPIPSVPEEFEVLSDHIEADLSTCTSSCRLQFTELLIYRLADHQRFQVAWYLLPTEVSIHQDEIRRGMAIIPFQPGGIFRVRVFDRMKQPLAWRRLAFFADRITGQLRTDEHGEFVFLGNPTIYRFDINREIGITIEPM